MRVLFATTPDAGHFDPLVPFAHACLRAGHDVLVVGHAGAEPLAKRANLRFRAVDEPSPAEIAAFRAGQSALSAGAAMARAFTDLYVGLYGKAALPGMLAAVEQWRPDDRDALDALAALPARILVAIGDSRDPAELGPVPPSVRVEHWVPQAAVLRTAAVTVGHGGAGSVLGALAAGVPMALVPMFADQPFNARLIADLGAGLVLEDASALEPAVRTLLDDSRFRDRARRIADEIAALPPVDAAADALAALAEKRAWVGDVLESRQ